MLFKFVVIKQELKKDLLCNFWLAKKLRLKAKKTALVGYKDTNESILTENETMGFEQRKSHTYKGV